MKKIIALVLALAMVMTMATAFAATTATVAQDAGVVIIGLETGDTVKLYQVLQWNTNTGWGKTSAFSSLKDASVATLVGTPDVYDKDGNKTSVGTAGTLTPAIASEIKGIYDANTSMAYVGPKSAGTITEGFGVKFTTADDSLEAGLYMAIITPAATNNVVTYNPVFVACDYDPNNANSVTTVTNLVIDNVGYAKKETDITVDKTVTDFDPDPDETDEWATAELNEEVMFTVDTTIPSYHADEWDIDQIGYEVTDTLNGLALVNTTGKAPTVSVRASGSSDAYSPLDSSKYELTAADGSTKLTLKILPAYLKEITGPMSLKITYYAKVTNDAVTNVSATDNTVEVKYSNDPTDETKFGKKHDKTNHYQFALDAVLFGDENYETSELVKIGLDKNGQEVWENTNYSNYSKHSALQGAKFALADSYDAAYALIGTDGTLTSDEDGKFLIGHLDVGTYYLVETKAPDGYIRDQLIYKIEISATEKHVSVNDGDCIYETDVLDTYTVKVSTMANKTDAATQIASSTYTMEYTGDPVNGVYTTDTITLKSSSKVTSEEQNTTHPEDNTAEIKNTQGTQLPSTGGIGTTIFYIVGGLLLVGAAVILVARKKSND